MTPNDRAGKFVNRFYWGELELKAIVRLALELEFIELANEAYMAGLDHSNLKRKE